MPDRFWNKQLSLQNVAITEWVPRIPGLYFMQGRRGFNPIPDSAIESRLGAYTTYQPMTKSEIVLQGIGTFVLPPDDEGKRIMTVSDGGNATGGIPILIFPEVIEHHNIQQGTLLSINGACWRQMSQEWGTKFDSVNQIKRGYLVVTRPEQVTLSGQRAPIRIHPFSIMEYHSNSSLLYDYVYCTAYTDEPEYRDQISSFFDSYKSGKERYGRYLLAADQTNDLFEAEYHCPADLRRSEPDGKSQLNLLEERIRNTFYHNEETIRSLLEKIPASYPTEQEIMALAVQVGIPASMLRSASAAKMSVQLIDICRQQKLLETLINTIAG
jgi:hypothetical protein